MKTLFIGGTGIISTACTRLAPERGVDLWLLNRGQQQVDLPSGVGVLKGDIRDPQSVRGALGGQSWDVVVNWINAVPADIERDLALFSGRCGQYIFVSSASVYQKPPVHYLITESTPLVNPYWRSSQSKIACEELLMQAHRDDRFPVTIVRPSPTATRRYPWHSTAGASPGRCPHG
jgi:nucleoside-diphosphate-sugar epimerase